MVTKFSNVMDDMTKSSNYQAHCPDCDRVFVASRKVTECPDCKGTNFNECDPRVRKCQKCHKRLWNSHVHTCTGLSAEPVCAPSVPTEAKARKALPVFSGVMKYFPNAMLAVAQLSMIGNEQHNPGEPLHWAMEKSKDEGDALSRHQLDAGKRDVDCVRHSTKVAWRAWAQLEREILASIEAGEAPVIDKEGRTVL